MPDVLSQNEVDALLTAVDDGSLDIPESSTSVSELNTEISIYDFKRPERVSKDQMRALEMLHESFSRNFGAALSGFLRTIVEVKMASVEQLTYSECIMSLPNPTYFNLMSAEPLDGKIVLEINPSIVFPIIDKLLGGGATDSVTPDRELTDIEGRLAARITDQSVQHLKDTWNPILAIDFTITDTESNPQLMQIVPPNEVVVLICFEIKMGEASGMMNICIPFPVIEPIIGKFSTIQSWFAYNKKSSVRDTMTFIQSTVLKASLGVDAFAAETSVKVRAMLDLEPGDVLATEKASNAEFLMTVEGKPKFRGTAAAFKGKKAFKITSFAAPEDTI